MNEELQSTNDEFQVTNEALRWQAGELDEVNAFLESILESFGGGIVVVDRDLRVQVWNAASEYLWGVRPEDAIGAHMLSFDIGLPVERLASPVHACLAGTLKAHDLVLAAHNRKGQEFRCHVRCRALTRASGEALGVLLMMEEETTTAVVSALRPGFSTPRGRVALPPGVVLPFAGGRVALPPGVALRRLPLAKILLGRSSRRNATPFHLAAPFSLVAGRGFGGAVRFWRHRAAKTALPLRFSLLRFSLLRFDLFFDLWSWRWGCSPVTRRGCVSPARSLPGGRVLFGAVWRVPWRRWLLALDPATCARSRRAGWRRAGAAR